MASPKNCYNHKNEFLNLHLQRDDSQNVNHVLQKIQKSERVVLNSSEVGGVKQSVLVVGASGHRDRGWSFGFEKLKKKLYMNY
jgi:hypothetical protein